MSRREAPANSTSADLSHGKRPARFSSALQKLAKFTCQLVPSIGENPSPFVVDPETLFALLPVIASCQITGVWQSVQSFWQKGTSPSQHRAIELAQRWLDSAKADANHTKLLQLVQNILQSADDSPAEVQLPPLQRFVTYWYEAFLAQHAHQQRKQAGVYFTPPAVAAFTVRHAGNILFPESLSPWLDFFSCKPSSEVKSGLVFDPAVGSGIFLTQVIRETHAQFLRSNASNKGQSWQSFAEQQLLPGLLGYELLSDSGLLARLNIALTLLDTEIDLTDLDWHGIQICNSLLSPPTLPKTKHLAIVGNPPFASFSVNQGEWITSLVRGSRELPGYFVKGTQRLNERKTWLHDDYVKFFRLAQWLAESRDDALVAFVSNHGFLDNVTFRFMREELARVFPQIDIVDLHGNRKRPRQVETGVDENIFSLDQGIAITFLRRSPSATTSLRRADVLGSKAEKLQTLAASPSALSLEPLTISQTGDPWAVSSLSPNIVSENHLTVADLFESQTTAPVTARDRLVVGFSPDEVLASLLQFADPAIPDEKLRERFFGRPRTSRYPQGDTRSWKLHEIRRLLFQGELSIGAENIRPIWYRPWDARFLYWDARWIDWPRTQLCQWLATGSNRAFITRRQIPRGSAGSFFWCTDRLTLDGIIRSDNRGGESLFLLQVGEKSNLRETAKAQLLRHFTGQLSATPSDLDFFHFVYGLVHMPAYQEHLTQYNIDNFPPLFAPKSTDVFTQVAFMGEALTKIHLTDPSSLAGSADPNSLESSHNLQAFQVGSYPILKLHEKRLRQIEAPSDQQKVHTAAIEHLIRLCLRWQSDANHKLASHGSFESAFDLQS
ncbi:MAG: type ISP restriction/modification enzyme [Planctomycetaceae bacterium]